MTLANGNGYHVIITATVLSVSIATELTFMDVIIANLPSEIKSANMKVENLEKKMDRQEQYSRRHCNLIHGLKKDKKESTDIEF